MRKIQILYNPAAGNATFRHSLDRVIGRFQSQGIQALPFRTGGPDWAREAVLFSQQEEIEAMVSVGGDGTLNQIVNAMLTEKSPLPLGIIPAGTANDMARHLGLSKDVDEACSVILGGKTRAIDVGLLNGRYFVNVASAGAFTDVSHHVNPAWKQKLGKGAYYLKGLEQLAKLRPLGIRIDQGPEKLVHLFMILNSPGAGGFNRLAPKAQVDDGKLDLVLIHACPLSQLVAVFVQAMNGGHLENPLVEYLQVERLTLSSSDAIETDLDGEAGPPMPWEVSVVPRGLPVFVPSDYNNR